MKIDRKEQRPDVMVDGSIETSARLDDPSLHYRIVSKGSVEAPAGRVARHRNKGYTTVAEDAENVVMACPIDVLERRQEESREKSERRLRGQNSAPSDTPGVSVSKEHDTMEYVKGDE